MARGQVSTALVTGAGSPNGIGFAAAVRLGRTGHHVAAVATGAHVHERVEALRAMGFEATGYLADLRDEEQVAGLMHDIARSNLRVDVLVNNAGMTSQHAGQDAAARLEDLTIDQWRDSLQRNLDSAFLMCRAVVPIMRRRQYGRIVNVASTTGPVSAFQRAAAYAAAKAGMVGMTRALALEVAAANITVNAVAPGWIDTASATPAERRAGRATPVGRSGHPDEVAAAIEFLASADAAYVTGQMLIVDGGNAIVEDLGRG